VAVPLRVGLAIGKGDVLCGNGTDCTPLSWRRHLKFVESVMNRVEKKKCYFQ
jgi:hypothetical protein